MRRFLFLLLAGIAAGCDAADADAYRPLQAGDAAPSYAAPSLAGDTVSLVSLRGQPVVLNVWATWCAPCRKEMPALQELEDRFAARGLQVVAVSVDEHRGQAQSFVDELGLTMTVLHDPAARIMRTFRTTGVPETFLLGQDGRIVRRWIGAFDPLDEDVIALVERTLATAAAR